MSTFKNLHKHYMDCHTNYKFNEDKIKERFIKDGSIEISGYGKIAILKEIYNIVLNNNILNEFSIIYLKNSNITVREVTKLYNIEVSNKEDSINEGTGRSRIAYGQRKINDIFKDVYVDNRNWDIITWIFDNNTSFNKDKYSETDKIFISQIIEFKDKYINQSMFSKDDIIINIPKYDIVNSISEEEYENFMDIIRPYGKEYAKRIEDMLSTMEKELGYLRFLMNTGSILNDTDKERRDDILRWLGKQ